MWAIPGDPIRALSGERSMPASVRAALEERYHLNEPLWKQYGFYISDLFHGDFGEDFRGREVRDLMFQRLPITARLAILAFGFELVIGIGAGHPGRGAQERVHGQPGLSVDPGGDRHPHLRAGVPGPAVDGGAT